MTEIMSPARFGGRPRGFGSLLMVNKRKFYNEVLHGAGTLTYKTRYLFREK